MTRLDERVGLVTGASRGVGREVALGLHEAGCTVYASGRTVAGADLPPDVVRAPYDHMDAAAWSGSSRASTPSAGGTEWQRRRPTS